MKGSIKLKVEENDIDELGHVNNSIYVKYLEKARAAWYAEIANFPFSEMIRQNLGTVVVNINITFNKEVFLGDVLTINTKPVRLGVKSFTFSQDVYNQKNELVTEAVVTTVMFDPLKRVGIPVVQQISEFFKL